MIDTKQLTEKYYLKALDALKEVIKINTVYDEKSRSKTDPFGIGVSKGLNFFKELGETLGFKSVNYDNYVTELSYGEGKILDIYAHTDVVPVSEHWESDPFYPSVKNNIMYARGASDDKGPAIAAIYACKALLDEGYLGNFKLRIIIGGNEERDSLCLDHYFNKLNKPYPDMGFSPDGNFPLIYAEKTICNFEVEYENIKIPLISSFHFGEAFNVVLDEFRLKNVFDSLKLEEYIAQNKEGEIHVEGDELVFKGKPAHGSTPDKGINAACMGLTFLGTYYNIPRLIEIASYFRNGNGEEFNGNYTSVDFASSSYCLGKISYENETLKLSINSRFPNEYDVDLVMNNLKANTNADRIKCIGGSKGFKIDLDSPLIVSLLKAYQEVTSDYESKPLAIGGGTYARESKNSVAFGMEFPGVDTLMHQDGEFLPLDDFKKGIEIYIKAIYELGKVLSK